MKLNRTVALVLLVLCAAVAAFGQSATGRVRRAPTTHQLTVTASVGSFTIAVDGEPIKGNTVEVTPGNHTIIVRADGYRDWTTTVNVTSNTTIRADLVPDTYTLQVQPNLSNATIYIDGRRVGSGRISQNLRPGTYTIRISAPGFIDFTTTVRLNGNEVVQAALRPAPARVIVQIPDEIQTPGTRDVISLVKVFLNGQLQPSTVFDVDPGRHSIRLTSGGFSVEQTYILDAGRTYTIVPNLTLTISQ